jgi:hypothetical protein
VKQLPISYDLDLDCSKLAGFLPKGRKFLNCITKNIYFGFFCFVVFIWQQCKQSRQWFICYFVRTTWPQPLDCTLSCAPVPFPPNEARAKLYLLSTTAHHPLLPITNCLLPNILIPVDHQSSSSPKTETSNNQESTNFQPPRPCSFYPYYFSHPRSPNCNNEVRPTTGAA